MTKTAVRPGYETEQALLDAAERLLFDFGAAGITTRRVAVGGGV
jgi:AcrR family transcriptional regulator